MLRCWVVQSDWQISCQVHVLPGHEFRTTQRQRVPDAELLLTGRLPWKNLLQ